MTNKEKYFPYTDRVPQTMEEWIEAGHSTDQKSVVTPISTTNKGQKMNAMYIPYDGNDFLTGEIVFESEQFTHLMIDGTDTIAVLPSEDIYPS